jgi:hypothetical protein
MGWIIAGRSDSCTNASTNAHVGPIASTAMALSPVTRAEK